ncbi:hypothetical protein AB0C38_18150 [Amycolatopsis sp. NPDC048633]|uniref:hypothetical protein n=1 Tax=Amycolatopsis sp. NPDC048633 TaxID=3157095 RepID=UPI0033ED2D45
MSAIAFGVAAVATTVIAPAAAADRPAVAAAAITPPAATAGQPTVQACCSYIANQSSLPVAVYKHWTCDHGTTGTAATGCANPAGTSRWLSEGSNTPVYEDWDVLRIDAGWCYRVRLTVPFNTWTVTYNRIGLGHTYVKVEDWGTATVLAQATGGCP